MAALKRGLGLRWLLVVLCLVPVGLFAYVGQFTRMMRDDYGDIATGKAFGALGAMIHRRETWNGAYSDYFLHGLLSPLGWEVVRVMPVAIIVLWYVGLVWLLLVILRLLRFKRHQFSIALSLGSLVLATTINGFFSFEALLFYSASVRYSLPLALLTICIAATAEGILRLRSRHGVIVVAMAVGAICFVIAGFSEMYLVFQSITLSLLLVVTVALLPRSYRRLTLLIVSAGWLATLMSGLVQLTAPGVGVRVEWYVGRGITFPLRTLPELIPATVDGTLLYVADQTTFAGFTILFAAGLFLALAVCKPEPKATIPQSFALPQSPLWIGLITQVCFVPLLWAHTSDNPQVFGRFSYAFMVVICLNVLAILVHFALLWKRNHLTTALLECPDRVIMLSALVLLVVLGLFGMTQIRSIHYKAAAYFYVTAIAVLGWLSWTLASWFAGAEARRGAILIILCLAAIAITAVALLGVANYSIGYVRDRAMTPLSWLQTITGLIWGAQVGYWLRQAMTRARAGTALMKWFKVMSLSVVLAVGGGIFLGRLQWIPELSLYAREWDARHRFILEMRDRGLTHIEVRPLTYDLSRLFWDADISTGPEDRLAGQYYGVESIVQIGE